MVVKKFLRVGLIKIVIILILPLISCTEMDFYENVASDVSNASSYISIEVSHNECSALLVLKNSDLYYHFSESLSYDEYVEAVSQAMREKEKIEVSLNLLNVLKKYSFIECGLNSYFDSMISQNKMWDKNGTLVCNTLNNDEIRCLIKYLFDNKYFVKTDCESGALYVETK